MQTDKAADNNTNTRLSEYTERLKGKAVPLQAQRVQGS